MSYQIQLPQFEGPFDLLLGLIEKEKLDITEISLTKVTDEFLGYLDGIDETRMEELADFLEIAAKLLLIKSKLLIPGAFEDEEESGEELVERLKIYREFLRASKEVGRIVANPKHAFAREKIPLKIASGLAPDIRITPGALEKYFKNILNIAVNQMNLARKTIRRRIVSLKEKVDELLNLIGKRQEVVLNNFIERREKIEKVVMFWAVLELVRKRTIVVSQKGLFKDIIIKKI